MAHNSNFCFLVTQKIPKIIALKLQNRSFCAILKVRFLHHYFIHNITDLYYTVGIASRLLEDTICNLAIIKLCEILACKVPKQNSRQKKDLKNLSWS